MGKQVTKKIFFEILEGVEAPQFEVINSFSNRGWDTRELYMSSHKPFNVTTMNLDNGIQSTTMITLFIAERQKGESRISCLERLTKQIQTYSRWYREYLKLQVSRNPLPEKVRVIDCRELKS